MSNEEIVKTVCICENPILDDESAIGLGIQCAKCGRDGESRIEEYLSKFAPKPSSLTEEQRTYIKNQIEIHKRLTEMEGS